MRCTNTESKGIMCPLFRKHELMASEPSRTHIFHLSVLLPKTGTAFRRAPHRRGPILVSSQTVSSQTAPPSDTLAHAHSIVANVRQSFPVVEYPADLPPTRFFPPQTGLDKPLLALRRVLNALRAKPHGA